VAIFVVVMSSCGEGRSLQGNFSDEGRELADTFVRTVKSSEWRSAERFWFYEGDNDIEVVFRRIHVLLNEPNSSISARGVWRDGAYVYRRTSRDSLGVVRGEFSVVVGETEDGLRVLAAKYRSLFPSPPPNLFPTSSAQ
jgi:hypothetical protein